MDVVLKNIEFVSYVDLFATNPYFWREFTFWNE